MQDGPNDPPGRANLRPFHQGDPRAIAAGRKGAMTRQARRAIARGQARDVSETVATLVATHERGILGPVAAAAAIDAIGRVARGEVTPRDWTEWVRVMVDVARLEEGQHTSAALVAHLGSDDTAARVAALQTSARAALARVNGNGSPITTAMGEQSASPPSTDA